MSSVVFIDIEGTIIDSLDSMQVLDKQCDSIKKYIKEIQPDKVHLFTWGWKYHTEKVSRIADTLFDLIGIHVTPYNELGTERPMRGQVLVKSDSIETAIQEGWLKREDETRAIQPGMMAEFGISKIQCFVSMVSDICIECGCDCILIDDLVDKDEDVLFSKGSALLRHPARL